MGEVVSIGPAGPLGVDAMEEELLDGAGAGVDVVVEIVTALDVLTALVVAVLVGGGEAAALSEVVVDVGVEVAAVLEVELGAGRGAAALPATYSYMDRRLLPPQISEVSPEQVMLQDAPLSSVGAPPLLRVFPQKHCSDWSRRHSQLRQGFQSRESTLRTHSRPAYW